jgi:enamine deaminase RidA (YjgF/YER057c/UK114 family)
MIAKYLTFMPELEGSLAEEWRQCLKRIIYQREAGFTLIKLNLFIDLPDYETYIKVSREIGKNIMNAFGKLCPVFNITVHPPEKPWKVAVEAAYSGTDSSDVFVNLRNNVKYIVCTTDSGKEVWGSGLGFALFSTDTRSAAEAAFEQMKAILDAEGMSFNNLVRQWNYIGNILEEKNGLQNYQIFNEVRSEYYRKYRTVNGYPAATGIGMKLGGVTIDFCAVMTNEKVMVKPIENPNQINAYEYGQQVLKGGSGKGNSVKHPPKFERALFLKENFKSTLLISGTASIIGQDTIGIDDIEKQTRITIENINKLTEQRRNGQNIVNTDTEWGKYILLRVYIKNQSDFSKVKMICAEQFPFVPAIFIESDICRDNLLVEIETEFLINS